MSRKLIALTLLLPILNTAACAPPEEQPVDGTETSTDELVFEHMVPAKNATNVARDIGFITIKFRDAIDCDNPIRGQEAFRVYTDTWIQGKRQDIWDQMALPFNDKPGILCDANLNEISLEIPGLLVGGALFHVQAKARGADGSELVVNSHFSTRNPGLSIKVLSVDNQISNCDTSNPFTNSENCDIYVVTRAKPHPFSNLQMNLKLPEGSEHLPWNDWTLNERKSYNPWNYPVLYQHEEPVGDPFAIELQAFDQDSSAGIKNVLNVLGAIGLITSSVWVPAAAIGGGLEALSKAIPADDDDPMGSGYIYLPKSRHWGANVGNHSLRIPGRAHGNQIVLNVFIEEYPASYFHEVIQ